MNRFTIKDVAAKSGTSIRTVSRVLNSDPHVKKETRDRVQAVIDELGFKVNIAARSLRDRKSNQIVVFADRRKNAFLGGFHNEVVLELHREAKTQGYRMVVSVSSPEQFEEDENDGFYLVQHGLCDAAILFDPHEGDRRVQYLREHRVPFVVLGQDKSSYQTSYVGLDNRAAGYMGAKYLHEKGHAAFALILGSEASGVNQDRAEGFRRYQREKGLDNQVLFGLTNIESAYKKTQSLLEAKSVTAIFVSGDERVVGVYRAIQEAGLQVGRDIGVLGVDDLEMGRFLLPALTSLVQPKQEMSKLALELIMEQLQEEERVVKRVLFVPTIAERESV
ncbi:UNVERIFIED_CONTAM: DNA-binding LacI/PurR family transcriptional regulator [Brevibacillus sp. OAP136]|nr:LacI family DNA-binding transcriptional regulator [Brevibacillus fluminis]